MSATDRTVIKLKANSTAVIASSAYADTLPEELTKAGLSLVDTNDPELWDLVDQAIEQASYGGETAAVMRAIWAYNQRTLNIGKVPGKKPKKERK